MQSDQSAATQRLLLTIPQVARQLGISRAALYSLIAKRKGPPVIRLGRSVRISSASLKAWIQQCEEEQREA